MNAVNSSISQNVRNVNSKISTDLSRYAELAGMGENGVQMMLELYDGSMTPERFFEAYNAIYAAGRRGGDVRERYVSLLGENAAAIARNAGKMDRVAGDLKAKKTSGKGLQKDGKNDTIESTQSRRENSDGKVGNDISKRRNDQANNGKQSSDSEKEHRGNEGIVEKGRLDRRGNPKALVDEDSTGRKLTPDITQRLSGTVIVDSQGRPIQVVHATDANFDTFEKGDIGFHFGSDVQAQERAKRKNIEEPVYVRAYLNIKSPVKCTRDTMSWQPMQTALNMWDMGIITLEERNTIYALARESGGGYNSPAAIKLREILESKGYDGIAYPNGFEGEGTSYIAFHDEQIVRVENSDVAPDVQQAKRGKIETTQSRRENSDGKESGKEENERSDRRTEGGVIESQGGTRTENEDRSRVQGDDRETSQEIERTLRADRGFLGVSNDNSESPFDSSDIVQVTQDSALYEPQQTLINEYGIECYIIKSSAWKTSGPAAPAGTYKGKVYISEDFSGELVATAAPHEATHVMKHLKYQPYLDFVDKVADVLDRSNDDTQDLFDWIAEHIGLDYTSMSESETNRFYDEMNATVYGFFKTDLFEKDGYSEWIPNAFYDFDSYITELDAIHEQYKQDIKAKRDSSGTQPTDASAAPDVQQAKGGNSEWSTERIEGGKVKEVRPVSEIIEQIRHDFGINITKGHVRGKGVLGQYSRRNHGIRTKIANDLPTVAHELGHALDQRYGLTEKSKLSREMRSELVAALGALKGSYKQDLWVSEGLAEYMRRFLQNRDDAARTYPEFTKYFLNSLSKADRVLVDTLADEINAYYALDGDTATSSIRFREEGVPDARTALEKAREMGDGVYQAWVDANHGIRLFDEATGANTYKVATNAAYSDAIAGQIITGDLTDANGQYVAPGLKAALEGVNIGDKKIYREFGEYLVLRHGPERLNEGMRIFADERKNNAAFMEKRAGELEAAHPEFKEAADRLYAFQKQFLKTWAVDTGLLPSEVAEEWAKRWSFYVPLNRAVGKAGTVGAKRGYANQNNTVRKAIGSGLDIVHPVDNIINNIVKMVNAGVRNNVMLEITAQARAVGADATFLEEVPIPMKKKTADLTGVKAKLHDAFGAAGIGELLAEVERESNSRKTLSNEETVSKRLTNADLPDYIQAGGRQNKSKLKALDEGKQIILTSESAVVDFIDSSIHGGKNLTTVAYGRVTNRLSNDVGTFSKGKIDISDYYLELVPNDISHAYKEHLKAKQDGDIDLSLEDFHNIPQYLDNYDDLVYAIRFESGATRICVSKRIENGRVILIETVSKSRGSIEFKNIIGVSEEKYISEYENRYKKGNNSNTRGSESSNISLRDDLVSTNSISHKNENVNKKISTNSSSGKSDAWSKVDEIIESAIDDVLIQYGQGKAHGDVVTLYVFAPKQNSGCKSITDMIYCIYNSTNRPRRCLCS